ncbi:SMP-30/gluconolactonase/LRE family protein [Roseibium litorale]|uniref:Uncharacterized protein n=1 Tax=Roseibium litorale TaxID=2803841 RepID=A0ABR9CT44_9HYPH|nr:hypothetical protein [Roseibium litorale]MBD8893974.1 hypothetical protein [Roseibium litorale]
MSKTVIALTCALAGFSSGAVSAAPGEVPAGISVVQGFSSPESVLLYGHRRFVSNIGTKLEPLAKDGDGFISELSEDGQIVSLRAFPGKGGKLNAPKGMAATGNKLYVADIDRVVGFDLDTAEQVFEAKLPGEETAFANDLAVLNKNTLLLSDTQRNKVYLIDLHSGAFSEFATGIPGANGIAVGANGTSVYVVGLGAEFEGGDIFALDGKNPPRKLENGIHGILDGIAFLPDGAMIVSDWIGFSEPVDGRLLVQPADGSAPWPLALGMPIHGPADFTFDPDKGALWIPALLDNTVLVVQIPEK